MRLTTTANRSSTPTTTTKPRARARYIDWSSLFQAKNFRHANLSHAMIIPANIQDYTRWVKRQKRVRISHRSNLAIIPSLSLFLAIGFVDESSRS